MATHYRGIPGRLSSQRDAETLKAQRFTVNNTSLVKAKCAGCLLKLEKSREEAKT